MRAHPSTDIGDACVDERHYETLDERCPDEVKERLARRR